MKNHFKILLLISSFIVIFKGVSFAAPLKLKSVELISNAKAYDDKLVIYSGEVIGDVMLRGDFAWVNINDGDSAIGIWINSALAKEINFTGAYKSQGDIVEITGVFHRACLEHGGDLDIHAQTLRKTTAGKIIEHKADSFKMKLILILLGALFLVWISNLFRRK